MLGSRQKNPHFRASAQGEDMMRQADWPRLTKNDFNLTGGHKWWVWYTSTNNNIDIFNFSSYVVGGRVSILFLKVSVVKNISSWVKKQTLPTKVKKIEIENKF